MTVIIALLLQIGVMTGDVDTNKSDYNNTESTIVIDELVIGGLE